SNSSLNTPKGVESVNQNDSGTSLNNDTQVNDIGKVYVDEYPQYEPLVIEQPLEEKILIDNSLEGPWRSNQQPFLNNQTVSNEVHDIEEPVLPKNGLHQQDNQDSVSTNEGSSLDDGIDNPKADTSNSYSSIPIGMSLPLRN
ncbi:MAG: hypothetical protein ACRD8Z_24345, partial [Nitrososphaeraceae archaeon]